MRCEERFYDYIDYVKGKLPLDVSLEIDKHILSCNRCKKEVENIRSFTLTLDDFNVVGPTDIYFTNLVPIINEKIENSKKIAIEKHNILFSVVSVIVFAIILAFTYNVSNTQISTQTFVNYEMESITDNYALFSYTTYEDIDNNVEKVVTEAIAGLLFQGHEDWFSSQENFKSYVASFSDDELNNIIDKLKNRHIIN
jgi:hypothetical protein